MHSGTRLLLAEDALADALEDPAIAGLGLETLVFTRAAGAGLDDLLAEVPADPA